MAHFVFMVIFMLFIYKEKRPIRPLVRQERDTMTCMIEKEASLCSPILYGYGNNLECLGFSFILLFTQVKFLYFLSKLFCKVFPFQNHIPSRSSEVIAKIFLWY